MSALARLLGAFAPGHTLDHEGCTYVFGAVTQATKAALETAYFRRAREAVYVMRGHVSESQYEALLGRVTDAWTRGQYGFPMGESFSYYLGPGLAELVEHLTGCTRDEAQALTQDRTVDVLHVCLCVVTASFGDLKKKMIASEKADAPEVAALLKLLTLPDSIG